MFGGFEVNSGKHTFVLSFKFVICLRLLGWIISQEVVTRKNMKSVLGFEAAFGP